MSCPARKPTVWTLRKVSTQIILSMPRRLTRIDHFASCGLSVSWIITLNILYTCAGWSGSIHYTEAIVLVFSPDGSYAVTCWRSSCVNHLITSYETLPFDLSDKRTSSSVCTYSHSDRDLRGSPNKIVTLFYCFSWDFTSFSILFHLYYGCSH